MSSLESLAASALLGSNRRAPDWPELSGEFGATLSRIDRENAEKAALQAAGLIAVCALAGVEPPSHPTPADRAPEDTVVRDVPGALHPRLQDICADGPLRLRAEAMSRLAQTGYRWPTRFLPMALECGRREGDLRPFVIRAMGKRGLWLAAQNPGWTYATGVAEEGEEEDAWKHGTHEQRMAALVATRLRDATLARAWLQEALPTEGARERAALVSCLSARLSRDDEPLLETLLKDKSKEVRHTALNLLSSLPQSGLSTRMAGRIESCLNVSKRLLRSPTLSIEPPETFDSAWTADLMEEAPPKGSKYGARAWWLRQMVRSAPLEWWEARSSMAPGKLLEWARSSDWKDALIAAWADAVLLQRRASWAEALLKESPTEAGTLPINELLSILPQKEREEQALALMRRSGNPNSLSTTLACLLQAVPLGETLSHDAAARILILLRGALESSAYDAALRSQFAEFAAAVPSSLIDAASSGWPAEGSPSVVATITRFTAILDHRRELHRLPP